MKVFVIGSGTMGSGIAQIAATQGCNTILYDLNKTMLEKSKEKLEKILNRLIEKERIDQQEKERIQSNLKYTIDLNELKGADLVIEAIVENLEIKKKVFHDVESIVGTEAIIASNTSSLSITSLASSLRKPERCIGLHFFNPAPLMKLVEIIPALQTNETTYLASKNIISSWGKTIVTAKDTPGFIVNKVARPFYSESIKMLEEGLIQNSTVGKKAFDMAMQTIGGFRMGPFQLMDFIGHDVNYKVTHTVWNAFFNDPRYTPSFSQKRLVEAGYLGKKSGRGFYDYEALEEIIVTPDFDKMEPLVMRVVYMLINEAADTLHKNIASKQDIDLAMTKGVNYPKGLLAWADELGIHKVVKEIDTLYEEYHSDRYRCSPLLRKMLQSDQKFFQ